MISDDRQQTEKQLTEDPALQAGASKNTCLSFSIYFVPQWSLVQGRPYRIWCGGDMSPKGGGGAQGALGHWGVICDKNN